MKMRVFFIPILVFLFCTNCVSQGLTGIWRGYFIQNDFDVYKGKPVKSEYKYEVQLNNLVNNGIEGVTYSYKTTVFYGKASLQGIYTKATKNLVLKELKLLEQKITDNSSACLMTCYLDYKKENGKETLTGTFISTTQRNTDGGSGIVYLEKVPTTAFEKEPFLLKKKTDPLLEKMPPNTINKPLESNVTKPSIIQKEIITTPKPGAEVFIIDKKSKKLAVPKPQIFDTIKPLVKAPEKRIQPVLPIPKVLQERENNLQEILIVDQEDVQIDYYDNGQIDNDSITVYHNNEVLINRGRLDTKPLTLHIHLDENNPFYELITVAVNLGDVPPNTALMVVTAGRKRFEVNITSDNKKNAKVILEYKPKEKNK